MSIDKNGLVPCWHRIPKKYISVAKDEDGKVYAAITIMELGEDSKRWLVPEDDVVAPAFYGEGIRLLELNEEYLDPNDIDWKESLCLRSEWEESLFKRCEEEFEEKIDTIVMDSDGQWKGGFASDIEEGNNHWHNSNLPIDNMCPEWKHSMIKRPVKTEEKEEVKDISTILSIDTKELATIVSNSVIKSLEDVAKGKVNNGV